MKSKFLILGGLLVAMTSNSAATAQTSTPQLARTLDLNTCGSAVDKYGKYYPLTIKREGKNAKITIYDDEKLTTVKKQFQLKDVYKEVLHFDEMELISGIDEIHYFYDFGQYAPGSNIYATQALYNEDDKWEIILEERTDPDSYETTFTVVNEDGEFVCVPGRGVSTFEEPAYFYFDGSVCYEVREIFEDDDELEGASLGFGLYRYVSNGSSESPSISMAQSQSRAYPNPLPAGRTLTVEFENSASANTTVDIFDATGRKITSVKAPEGENKVQIPSRRLRRGNFVYVVTRDGVIDERGKIIAH